MAKTSVTFHEVDEELIHKFQVEVAERYGRYMGNATKALEEAIRLWLEEKKS